VTTSISENSVRKTFRAEARLYIDSVFILGYGSRRYNSGHVTSITRFLCLCVSLLT